MRLPEQRLWDRMRINMKPFPSLLLERFENVVSVGVPDVHVLCRPPDRTPGRGLVTWVELKAVESPPARKTTRLIPVGKGLSREQKNWHLRWQQHCGRSLVIVGVEHHIQIAIEGRKADFINEMTMADMIEASCATTWGEIAWVLGSRP